MTLRNIFLLLTLAFATACSVSSKDNQTQVSDEIMKEQRSELDSHKDGFGPQAPRDIEKKEGHNKRLFGFAPEYTSMNLCNIHFHNGAEHKGGEFTTYIGNGDGHGIGTGYKYSKELSEAETKPFKNDYKLFSGETIEIHFVHTSADSKPGPTLVSCTDKHDINPDLRVETVVGVLVNDETAFDMTKLTHVEKANNYYQAINIPNNLGEPVKYRGSTTGPKYNVTPSKYQVSWNVRPHVLKINIASVKKWLDGNEFNETHGHGVRNLVINPELLSEIE